MQGEIVQTFQIVGQAYQFPFGARFAHFPKKKLPESKHVLDDPEHRFDRMLALGVDLLSRLLF